MNAHLRRGWRVGFVGAFETLVGLCLKYLKQVVPHLWFFENRSQIRIHNLRKLRYPKEFSTQFHVLQHAYFFNFIYSQLFRRPNGAFLSYFLFSLDLFPIFVFIQVSRHARFSLGVHLNALPSCNSFFEHGPQATRYLPSLILSYGLVDSLVNADTQAELIFLACFSASCSIKSTIPALLVLYLCFLIFPRNPPNIRRKYTAFLHLVCPFRFFGRTTECAFKWKEYWAKSAYCTVYKFNSPGKDDKLCPGRDNYESTWILSRRRRRRTYSASNFKSCDSMTRQECAFSANMEK